jgi:hypothetical protein
MARRRAISRRDFLERTSVAAALGALGVPAPSARAQERRVALIVDPLDPVATSTPAHWAADELGRALMAQQVDVELASSPDQARSAVARIRIAGFGSQAAQDLLRRAGTSVAAVPEALALVPASDADGAIMLAAGHDARGLSYAVTELADRIRHGADPIAALRIDREIVEQPANSVRSIARCFESDVEDKGWFHDRAMWRDYLSMLATQRFNRFNMTFGLQYNYPMEVSDVYLYFAYPFLLSVPGYDVRVRELPAAERERNLETLQFIGREAVGRGLDFQVGLWTHGYKLDSPKVNYHVEGITAQNHAAYCRDALTMLLQACPQISGITFRIHGESGIAEGDFAFWRTVFAGIAPAGRPIEIDMHAKGIDQQTIDLALETGMPVKLSPKYLGEHIGLPYHQSAVRELERPPRTAASEHFALSNGLRRFTRYSYGDFLKEDRRHGVLFRIWPGTQRALLWGDPEFAAGYGRHASFCGSQGFELCEPLAFKGRMGSGQPGGRTAYADQSLAPAYDWQKFAYTYRLWGRLTYNPDASPQTWRRQLASDFGPGAAACEAALAKASRILPLITLAHAPSASNNAYWPEMYTNMSIVRDDPPRPYYDAGKRPRFGAVEPFDPQLFSRIDEYADEVLSGTPGARYSPLEVAEWLDDLAGGAVKELENALAGSVPAGSVAFRRLSADVMIQCGIGRFFAAKFRSAVLWSLYERSGDREAAAGAVEIYRAARKAWAVAADEAAVYVSDISYGAEPWLRGHWRDRLPAIDADIAEMARQAAADSVSPGGDQSNIRAVQLQALQQLFSRPQRPVARGEHQPAARFQPGAPLEISIRLPEKGTTALLHYRHVNQAEAWRVTPMRRDGDRHAAVVDGDYTGSPYPLQYYFELRGDGGPSLFPGLNPNLTNQPYFVVRQA